MKPDLTEPVISEDTPGPPKSDVLAAVDIGTNSVHLVVARVNGSSAFEILAREKEMVRLGSGGGDMKHLDDPAMDRGVEALARFRQVALIHGADLRAVATSAVREAENRHAFIERARTGAGVDVEVVSGPEEARLIHLGVLQAVPVFDQQLFLCDIGGGSTELLVGHRGETLRVRSLKLGSIRLTQRFFDADRLRRKAVESCRNQVRSAIAPFAKEVRKGGFEVAIGSSGTIGALCAMALAQRGDPPARTLNNFVLSAPALGEVVTELAAAPTVAERAGLVGLDPRRADIILAGALILEGVFERFRLEQITFSDYALREGVLLDTWQRRHGGSLHHLSDIRRRSVTHLASVMDEDPAHSAQVARLALDLFDQTADRHGLGDDAREYLEAAALLCNVGLFLSHAAHHKHGYYVIRNSEHLAGFTDREIELIALIARYHRKSAPKAKHPEFAAIDGPDQRLVRACAGLLRVAIGFDRNQDARVERVVVTAHPPHRLRLAVAARDGADISLELFSAAERTDLLEDTLGATVEIVASSADS